MALFKDVKLFQKLWQNHRVIERGKIASAMCTGPTESPRKIKSIKSGPSLRDFIRGIDETIEKSIIEQSNVPYLQGFDTTGKVSQKVFFDVYGCQMNVNDTEIVWSILKDEGFIKTDNPYEADVFLVMTCAIREGAESKIWHRLQHLRSFKRRRATGKGSIPVKIGILGCMAERLKEKLIEKEKSVDLVYAYRIAPVTCQTLNSANVVIGRASKEVTSADLRREKDSVLNATCIAVAGPDSYKDLPRLLALTDNSQTAVNVLLSLDETYADVMPVRLNQDSVSAFVSIMRGCDNMCTYCIVPFTRGRERSRPVSSILDEVRHLSDHGIKEITLLGQNVNSYRDVSDAINPVSTETNLVKGFKTVYKTKKGGLRFADLLAKVSAVDPDMRIRFTSPHPKDFPDEVLQVIAERPNICNSLHLPAQSGSTAVLQRMRRGYSREAYLELIEHVRESLPGVGLTSDFICGFSGETDEEFQDTLSLLELVKYNVAYLFPYSMREKTTAHRRYQDDVPEAVKAERHLAMVEVFRRNAEELHRSQIGQVHLVLAEGVSKRSLSDIAGRNEQFIKVIFPQCDVLDKNNVPRAISPGDFVAVKIVDANSQVFKGMPLYHTSIRDFYGKDFEVGHSVSL